MALHEVRYRHAYRRDTTTPLEQMATPARRPCRRRFGGWKVRALILATFLA